MSKGPRDCGKLRLGVLGTRGASRAAEVAGTVFENSLTRKSDAIAVFIVMSTQARNLSA
jgi:hypothetical protein